MVDCGCKKIQVKGEKQRSDEGKTKVIEQKYFDYEGVKWQLVSFFTVSFVVFLKKIQATGRLWVF